MIQKTDCFIACQTLADAQPAIDQLQRSYAVRHIWLLVNASMAANCVAPKGCSFLVTDSLQSTDFLMLLAKHAIAPYILLCQKAQPLLLGANMLERMMQVASDTNAACSPLGISSASGRTS